MGPIRLAAVAAVALALAGAAASAETRPTIEITVLRFVDHSRLAHFRNGTTAPRTLVTSVRYPSSGRWPLPLVVFAHGFATTPTRYALLLDAWARAGYAVAAPVFPVESATAPGGPDERDLWNQPADVSFVLSRLIEASADAGTALHGLVDPRRVAVAGQSDGGETAFAVAYERRYADRRVRAALVLSGAELPGSTLLPGGPPLLAAQGTADTINRPRFTARLFADAPRPKFLLELLGSGHLPPYTMPRRGLAIVERTTIAFLDRYVAGRSVSLRRLLAAGDVPGVARLRAAP